MLRRALSLVLALLAAPATAQTTGPVVVELYTSQGCSACPPADALLRDLAAREDVIALGLHVDYWDYLGWRDVFASPAATARQHAYADVLGERMVYTPQIVVNGTKGVVGSRLAEVEAAIAAARGQPMPTEVRIAAEGDGLMVRVAAAAGPVPPATVGYMTHASPQTVTIGRGENGGATFTYANPVRAIMRLGIWKGAAASWPLPMPQGDGGLVVLVQDAKTMAVLGAAAYRME